MNTDIARGELPAWANAWAHPALATDYNLPVHVIKVFTGIGGSMEVHVRMTARDAHRFGLKCISPQKSRHPTDFVTGYCAAWELEGFGVDFAVGRLERERDHAKAVQSIKQVRTV